MHFPKRKHILLLLFCIFGALNISAQDLLVRQATSDKKLSTTDSVTSHRRIAKNIRGHVSDYTNVEPYCSWDNGAVYAYKGQTPPTTFKIDLRNFVMPTPSRKITSRYGYRASFGRNHYGLDVKIYTGDTIVSAWEGKVRVVKYEPNGWGRYVVVRHPNGLETLYAHLSRQLVVPNQEVKAGEVIGLGGNTGRSTGSHLHLECRVLGQAINPEILFDFPNQKMTSDFYTWHSDGKASTKGVSPYAEKEQNEAEEYAESEKLIMQPDPSKVDYYRVEKNETIETVAKKLGVTQDYLLNANGLSRKAKLRAGMVLKY